MSKQVNKLYKFGQFILNGKEGTLHHGNQPISLAPRCVDLLILLVEHQGEVLSKDELLSKVWQGVVVEEGNLKLAIHLVRKALELEPKLESNEYIETVPKRGYRFIAPVTVLEAENASESTKNHDRTRVVKSQLESAPNLTKNGKSGMIRSFDRLERALESHWGFVVTTSIVFSLIYSEGLVMQIAYKFDELGSAGLKATPYIFFWMLLTSIVAFGLDMKLAMAGRGSALYLHCLLVVCSSAAAFFMARPALPSVSVVLATFQTNTAQAAYLKDICFCIVLAIFFLVVPFNFIISVERELESGQYWSFLKKLLGGSPLGVAAKGAIYLRLRTLWALLGLIGVVVLYSGAHLLNHLRTNPRMNLYMELIYLHWFLYFGLAFQGLGWYYERLRELQARSLQAERLK